VDKRFLKGKHLRMGEEDDEAIDWFAFILPRLKQQIRKEKLDIKMYEVIQEPGDIIFVPQNWWHAVINLENSVAITQNFVG
jgi:histone arginine demethylase JMJD6